jgi:hypothetical protein
VARINFALDLQAECVNLVNTGGVVDGNEAMNCDLYLKLRAALHHVPESSYIAWTPATVK